MPPNGHALLGASSSHRWLNCPPSARLGENYADKGSDFAAEGTDAHALCEYKLRKALGMAAADPTENLSYYNAEMEECAEGYAAYILELVAEARESCADPIILIEQHIDYSSHVKDGLGKQQFSEILGAYVEKPQGKPALVPESDKRPAISTAKNDFMEEL